MVMRMEDNWEEIKEEIELEPIKEEHPWLKKVFIGLIGAFMLFLVLTYFLGYMAFDNIPGLIESGKIEGYAVKLNDETMIRFDTAAYNELISIFKENEGNETKLCLIGEKQGSNVMITGVHKPLIIAQDFRSVTAKPCPSGTMISLHTHPMMHCTPSMQDYKSLRHSKDSEFAAVMCTENRLYFY